MSARATRNSRAFTLIEVIVVMALMAVVMGLAAVYFAGNRTSSKMTRSAREITGTIKYARVLAAETGTVQAVVFDLDARSYGIEGRTTKRVPADVVMKVSDEVQGEIGSGKHAMHLLPSGSVEGRAIVLQAKTSTVSIQPDPIMGVIVVKE